MENRRALVLFGVVSIILVVAQKYLIVVTEHNFLCEQIDSLSIPNLRTIGLYKLRLNSYTDEAIGLYFGPAKPYRVQDFFYVDLLSSHKDIAISSDIVTIERNCTQDYVRYSQSQSPVLIKFNCQKTD